MSILRNSPSFTSACSHAKAQARVSTRPLQLLVSQDSCWVQFGCEHLPNLTQLFNLRVNEAQDCTTEVVGHRWPRHKALNQIEVRQAPCVLVVIDGNYQLLGNHDQAVDLF